MNPSCDICWEDIEEIDMDTEFSSDGSSVICFKCQSESNDT